MKKKKKQTLQVAGWAIAHFMSLSHDITSCIVTQAHRGVQQGSRYGQQRATRWPQHGQGACDMAGLLAKRAARACEGLAAGGECRDTKIVS